MNGNAVFNPRIYELMGGVIEDFDPAYASRERARMRAIQRQEDKKYIKKLVRKAKLKRQRKLGKLSLAISVVCLILGFSISEMYFIAIWFLLMAGAFLISKKPIIN